MHLKRYQECINDINKASAITKSVQLKYMLQDGKKQCLALLHNIEKNQIYLENLSLNSSEDDRSSIFLTPTIHSDVIPDASNSITLRYNDIFGRHFIATRDIKPGEVIINEKGFICFPYTNQLYLVCSHCLKFAWNAIPCDYCIYTVYCSEACEKEAWQEYHNEECSTLPYFHLLTTKVNIVDVMAITRLLIKAIKKEGLDNVLNEAKISKYTNKQHHNSINKILTDGILRHDKFRSYYNLMYNNNRVPNNDKDDAEHYESVAINLLFRFTNLIRPKESVLSISFDEEITLIELKDLFVKFRNIFNTNATMYQGVICNCSSDIECSENCPTKRGFVIGPCSSLVNHSCNPNVEKMCVPYGKIVLFATAPIKKGDQICQSYGPIFTTEKAIRQKFLEEHFFFFCECTACSKNWPTYEEMNFCKDPKTDHIIMLKVRSQIEKEFINENISSSFNKIIEQSEFDMETLKHAIKFSEWVYDHYENGMAFMMSITYKTYINTAFYKLFGEKCIIPAIC
ncbi:SET and MYND domain-containing protein 4-like isoform X2 [Phymastichus coffea]|nr:SET and MYND domain-containing protein 4-like isoform X2 [Phymastichus coffea]